MEDEVITSLLQTDSQSEPAVSETAHEPRGIVIAESTGELSARSDLDAILTEDWVAVERYGGLPPRSKAEVILDLATGESVTVYETAIARYDARRVAQPTAVPWIVSLPHFAPPSRYQTPSPPWCWRQGRLHDPCVMRRSTMPAFSTLSRRWSDTTEQA
jgi:hypothetical protein